MILSLSSSERSEGQTTVPIASPGHTWDSLFPFLIVYFKFHSHSAIISVGLGDLPGGMTQTCIPELLRPVLLQVLPSHRSHCACGSPALRAFLCLPHVRAALPPADQDQFTPTKMVTSPLAYRSLDTRVYPVWGPATNSAEPRVVGMGSKKSPSGFLGMIVRGPLLLPLLGSWTRVLFLLGAQRQT